MLHCAVCAVMGTTALLTTQHIPGIIVETKWLCVQLLPVTIFFLLLFLHVGRLQEVLQLLPGFRVAPSFLQVLQQCGIRRRRANDQYPNSGLFVEAGTL